MKETMSIEEALAILKPFRNCMVDQHGCPISDVVYALDLAMDALERTKPFEYEQLKIYGEDNGQSL